MTVLLENAYELETIAREIGAIPLKGYLRYPLETGGWTFSSAEALGDVDIHQYLAKFRDRKLVLIVAPITEIEPVTVTCGICGVALTGAGECASPAVTARCKLKIAERARELVDTGEDRDVVDQLGGLAGEQDE